MVEVYPGVQPSQTHRFPAVPDQAIPLVELLLLPFPYFPGPKSEGLLQDKGQLYLFMIPPPIRAIIFWNLPIFFIICCICANLLSMVFRAVTLTPLPLAMR